MSNAGSLAMSCHLRQKTVDNIFIDIPYPFTLVARILSGLSPLVLYPEEQAAAYAVEMLEHFFRGQPRTKPLTSVR